MRKFIFTLFPVLLLATACSSGSNTEAIKAGEPYTTVADYWDTFPADWVADVCDPIAESDDKEEFEKAVTVMRMMLKVNLSMDIDITKDDEYSEAIRVLLSENC